MLYERDILYKGVKYNASEIKKKLEIKGYNNIHTIWLYLDNEKLYAVINNYNSDKIELD